MTSAHVCIRRIVTSRGRSGCFRWMYWECSYRDTHFARRCVATPTRPHSPYLIWRNDLIPCTSLSDIRYMGRHVKQHNFLLYGNALTVCIRGIYFGLEVERSYCPHSERCTDYEFKGIRCLSRASEWDRKESLCWLDLWSPVVTICTTVCNIQQFYVPPTQCIYVFCVDLSTNSDYFPIQH